MISTRKNKIRYIQLTEKTEPKNEPIVNPMFKTIVKKGVNQGKQKYGKPKYVKGPSKFAKKPKFMKKPQPKRKIAANKTNQ